MANLVSIDQLLHTVTITKLVSEIKTASRRFQDTYRLGPNQPASARFQGYTFAWDYFNNTRKMAQGRPPNSSPNSANRQAVGQVTAVAHRLHEKIPLLDNELFRHRRLGAPIGTIDRYGANYIQRQAGYLAQRCANAREFMISRMLTGGFHINIFGDSRVLADSAAAAGGGFPVNYQIPVENTRPEDPGNAAGVPGFAANWMDASGDPVVATNILDSIYAVNRASARRTGYAIRHMWCSSKVWSAMQVNNTLRNVAGSANRVWEDLTPLRSDGTSGDTGFQARLTAVPWLTIHVTDEVLYPEQFGTELESGLKEETDDGQIPMVKKGVVGSKAVEHVIFTPDPDTEWIGMIEGSELVRVNKTAAPVERFGFTAWSEPTTQPGGRDLITLDICLPVLYVPAAVFYLPVQAAS